MLNTNEIWENIPEYDSLYQVSNYGNVRNARKRNMKFFTIGAGYKALHLVDNKVRKCFLVHRLVASVFCPNPLNKPDVNHLDGCKDNNLATNLEWVTKKENMVHAVKSGLLIPLGYATGFKKANAASKYHNVSYDKNRNSWLAAVYSKGIIKSKRFKNEIDAALYVNTLLDLFEITDRPKNIIS